MVTKGSIKVDKRGTTCSRKSQGQLDIRQSIGFYERRISLPWQAPSVHHTVCQTTEVTYRQWLRSVQDGKTVELAMMTNRQGLNKGGRRGNRHPRHATNQPRSPATLGSIRTRR